MENTTAGESGTPSCGESEPNIQAVRAVQLTPHQEAQPEGPAGICWENEKISFIHKKLSLET